MNDEVVGMGCQKKYGIGCQNSAEKQKEFGDLNSPIRQSPATNVSLGAGASVTLLIPTVLVFIVLIQFSAQPPHPYSAEAVVWVSG